MELISLTPAQQKLMEKVAAGIYRPCCNNHTLFPDCNHGMAMLGILQLMASQGATADEMFEAAKYINAYWFPQQTLETVIYLRLNQNVEFKNAVQNEWSVNSFPPVLERAWCTKISKQRGCSHRLLVRAAAAQIDRVCPRSK